MRIYLLVAVLGFIACSKPKISVPPCDLDLGYLSQKMHLANVEFLDEGRQIDWFELYENLDERRRMVPAPGCIPAAHGHTIEQQIERSEHGIRNLR